ncbi:MAG TPA: polysaccharide biosynthesis/export family protein [Bryobacteraceae bacterium]|nr:polysaccharide biosynthesis/export family protein [Bryobacteraceae bacterium]
MHRFLLSAICLSLLAVGANAQVVSPPPVPYPGPTAAEQNPLTNLPIQRLGPEDLISLSVYDSPEFSRTVRVATNGTIRLPMLKAPVQVQGLLPDEAATAVSDALKKEQLLVDPFVTVSVSEYHSRPVNVAGAVKNPVIFQAIGNVTLLDALSRAGGLADTAGPTIIVTRPNGSTDTQSVQRIPTKTLLAGTEPELNLKLTGGEEIRVPTMENIIVQGNVSKPGVYPVLDPLSLNTVTNAIAQAQGLAQYASHKAFIYRVDDQGVRHTIPVPLWDILQRRKPDMILQARDTLYIPDSPPRRIAQNTINSVTGVAGSAAVATIYVLK